MIRRSFRIGLRLGLLIGISFAVVKTVQSRRGSSHTAPDPWQPVPRPDPEPSPRPVDEVGEPVMEPAPAPADAVETPPEKQLLATDAAPASAAAARPARPIKKAAKKAAAAKKATGPAPAKKAAKRGGNLSAWVEPVGSTCPPTHPVKAKVASKLFHLPGMFAYDRTRPDRCYLDAAAAEGEGFTRAKR